MDVQRHVLGIRIPVRSDISPVQLPDIAVHAQRILNGVIQRDRACFVRRIEIDVDGVARFVHGIARYARAAALAPVLVEGHVPERRADNIPVLVDIVRVAHPYAVDHQRSVIGQIEGKPCRRIPARKRECPLFDYMQRAVSAHGCVNVHLRHGVVFSKCDTRSNRYDRKQRQGKGEQRHEQTGKASASMSNGPTESCTVKGVRSGNGISWRKNVSRAHSREKRTVLSIRAFFCPLPGELSCCTLIPHNPSPARYLLARVSQPVELLFGESTEGQKAAGPSCQAFRTHTCTMRERSDSPSWRTRTLMHLPSCRRYSETVRALLRSEDALRASAFMDIACAGHCSMHLPHFEHSGMDRV